MSSLTTLARPYAKAAFELAQAESNLARWDEMLALAGSLATDESMAGLLESPHVSSGQAQQIMWCVGDVEHALMLAGHGLPFKQQRQAGAVSAIYLTEVDD